MIDEKKLIEVIEARVENHEQDNEEFKSLVGCDFPEILARIDELELIRRIIEGQSKINSWIPVENGLPKEHDSIFARFKGTDKWNNAMFEKTSDDVIVTVQYEDGTRLTKVAHTNDGKWSLTAYSGCEVIAWMPLPEPYRKEEKI